MKLRYLALAMTLATTSLFLVACGAGSSSESNKTPDSATATNAPDKTSDSATATNAPDKTREATRTATSATTTPTPGGGGGSLSGSGSDELRKLAKDLMKKTYQVTYAFATIDGKGKTEGTMMLAQKPPKSITKFETAAESVILIDDGTASLLCTKKATDATGTCLKSASGGSATAAAFSLEAALNDLETNVNATVDKDDTIAGRAAKCFIVTEAGSPGSRACFDKQDGIALLLESGNASGGKYTLKATKVSNSVDDSIFDAPYAVTSLTP